MLLHDRSATTDRFPNATDFGIRSELAPVIDRRAIKVLFELRAPGTVEL